MRKVLENQQRQYGICYMEITENGNTKSLKKQPVFATEN